MTRWIGIIIAGIITSLFLFPFNLPIPGIVVNTKMVLAVFGAGLLVIDWFNERRLAISKDFLILSIICACVSLWAFFVTIVNGTTDYAFVTYFISVWVWLAAAYVVVWLIRSLHGAASFELIGNYLIGVCVCQCILAYLMTLYPGLKAFIDSLMGDSAKYMGSAEGRMYGLGAALDPAGLRFSAVLAVLAGLTATTDFNKSPVKGSIYFWSFVIISLFGNMISRTTIVGVFIAIALFIIFKFMNRDGLSFDRTWSILGGGLLIVILVAVWMYNHDVSFRNNLRFGFEGFFSLFETGHWQVRSTDILVNELIVWPETLKTWIIGDGYFASPLDMPDRFGQVYGGFYKHTDIGYLRYVFYFGSIGLLGLITVFVQMTMTCIRELKDNIPVFLSLLLINLVGWLKVSSDVIMVFAPYLIIAYTAQLKLNKTNRDR